jgi:hypothetical protein
VLVVAALVASAWGDGPAMAVAPPPDKVVVCIDPAKGPLDPSNNLHYSSEPNRRIRELLENSEDLKQIEREWERLWPTGQPSRVTPPRSRPG